MSAAMSNTTSGLTLGDLAVELARASGRVAVEGDASVAVSDVQHDSRAVRPGDLFVVRHGATFDGARFAKDAVARGALALVAEHGAALPSAGVPVVRVDDARRALGFAAEAVHGHPSRRLGVVGITGTNGKTTTSFLVRAAVDAAGGRAARLGTLGYELGDDVVPDSLTTPEADDLTRFAVRALARGGTHLAMEVSSIALSQARVDALSFAVAAFTNLTQDHLDFHGTMQSYAAAKARLFTDLAPAASAVNVDDPAGADLADRARGRVLRVSRTARADVYPRAVRMDGGGIDAAVCVPGGEVRLESRLVGAHNLDNLLLALAVAVALDLPAELAARGLSRASAVPGRLERCDDAEDDVIVLVDYAHTPDALSRVLSAVRPLTGGAVHCVFGCGGDRDPDKRPKMGAAVGAGADRATITSDNPRSEDPAAIARAVEVGLRGAGIPYDVVLDRRDAIERAVLRAAPGDVVLLAGKGHEPYQIVGAEKRDFDDRVEARRALALRRGGSR